jgi:hypothetical protein
MDKYECAVFTIDVPWKQGLTAAEWPFLPGQAVIEAKMTELGSQGWEVYQHVHGPHPHTDTMPQKVNIWARRVIPTA